MVVLDGCVEWVAVSEREREREREGCGDELENTTRACMRVRGWPQHAHCTSPETGRFRQIRAHQDLATTRGGGDYVTCCVCDRVWSRNARDVDFGSCILTTLERIEVGGLHSTARDAQPTVVVSRLSQEKQGGMEGRGGGMRVGRTQAVCAR
jgi:hypothetical protein